MARSGEICDRAGRYESACADAVRIEVNSGAPFPACPTHGDVTWDVLRGRGSSSRGTRRDRGRRGRGEVEWRTGSGERCRYTGLYESLCEDRIHIAVMKGSRFPTCGNHGDVSWVMVAGRRF